MRRKAASTREVTTRHYERGPSPDRSAAPYCVPCSGGEQRNLGLYLAWPPRRHGRPAGPERRRRLAGLAAHARRADARPRRVRAVRPARAPRARRRLRRGPLRPAADRRGDAARLRGGRARAHRGERSRRGPDARACWSGSARLRAFKWPASSALVPWIVSRESLPRAIALSSSTFQLGMIAGPALGGAIYVWGGPEAAYLTTFGLRARVARRSPSRSASRCPSASRDAESALQPPARRRCASSGARR